MSAPAAAVRPVVVELGSQRRSRIRALKRGEGRLMDDLARAMQKIRADSPELASKELVPIVMIYRRRSRRGKFQLPFSFYR